MKEYKQNILVVCLNDKLGQEIAHSLGDYLGILYASCREIVNYEVFDSKAVLEKCGIEYFQKKEKSAIKNVSKFENCVIFVDYEYFNKGYDYFIKSCNFVYVKAKKKQLDTDDTINLMAFEERDTELSERCEFVVPCKANVTKTVDEIIKQFRRKK